MPFPSEHAARQESPDKYKRFRRENGKLGKGIDVIWGIKEDGSVEMQSIRFGAEKFTVEEAKKWLKEHDFKTSVEPAKKEKASTQVRVHINNYIPRTETHLDRSCIVVPVVMMVEGVHSGNFGPVFHSSKELSKYTVAWDGIPVVVHHPMDDEGYVSANSPEVIERETVGRVYNSHFEDGKLKAEIWLDVERAMEISPEVLEHIQLGKPMDVSTGMFMDSIEAPENAVWGKESYSLIASNYRPDHLALLPDGEGACGWKDGCGIRTNQKGGNADMDVRELKQLAVLSGLSTIPVVNETSHDQTARTISGKLGNMDNGMQNHYLVEVYDDFFIFEVYPKAGSVLPLSQDQQQLFKLGYSEGEDGNIEFEGTPVPVVRQVEYVEKKVATFSRKKGVGGMEKPKETETGKEVCCLEKLQEMAKKEQEEGKKEEKPVVHQMVSQEQAISVLKQALNDPKQAIAILEGKAREIMEYGVQELAKKKVGLTEQILSANASAFSKEELEGKGVVELEKLVALIGKKEDYDYSGLNAGGKVVKAQEEIMLPAMAL